nr:palmitoyl-protein thioesterase 1-like [Tanacetum cinerariifolium]
MKTVKIGRNQSKTDEIGRKRMKSVENGRNRSKSLWVVPVVIDLEEVVVGHLNASLPEYHVGEEVVISIHPHIKEGRAKQTKMMLIIIMWMIMFPISSCFSLPFIVLHGIGDQCSNKGMTEFTHQLSNLSNSQGFCIEIGDGAWDSWFMPLLQQTQSVCEQVKNMHQLANGYNILGLSQGNLIARGVVEFCDGAPQVKNLISLGGPHAGTASVPLCGSGIFCKIADALIKSEIYSDYIQEHLAPKRNSTYKERFSSLENLVLIMFEQDTVVIPKETAWFGYFPYGEFSPVLTPQQLLLLLLLSYLIF